MSEIVSRVYQPNAAMCCEACVFGSGEHAEWCDTPHWITDSTLVAMSDKDLARLQERFVVVEIDALTRRRFVEPRRSAS